MSLSFSFQSKCSALFALLFALGKYLKLFTLLFQYTSQSHFPKLLLPCKRRVHFPLAQIESEFSTDPVSATPVWRSGPPSSNPVRKSSPSCRQRQHREDREKRDPRSRFQCPPLHQSAQNKKKILRLVTFREEKHKLSFFQRVLLHLYYL